MASRSKEQRLRDDIERFRIEFVGPVLPSEWPAEFQDLFTTIQALGNTPWLLHKPKHLDQDSDEANRWRVQQRAYELMSEAKANRRDRVNEPTLRGDTEPLVFERLKKAAKCKECSNYRWWSDIPAEPSNHVDAERLKKRRAQRQICRCHPDEWTPDGFDDPGETKLFRSYSDEFVHMDAADLVKRRGASRHKPDNVWGLCKTKSLAQYRAEFERRHDRPDLRHSPFANPDLLYPFLIVESKREGDGPGFEYAEAQSAFPIRTCLRLQEELARVSGQPHVPLVWFLAYQGDEWRVAACVVHAGKYQIYDLWMGRLVSKPGALQLLLIIDHIAEWARETYRFDILSCLAGGRDRVLGADNMSETYKSRISTLSLPDRSPLIARRELIEARQPSEEDVMIDLRLPVEQLGPTTSSVEVHHFLRWAQGPGSHISTSRIHTIRHTDMVLFTFVHLTIPEDREALDGFLAHLGRRHSLSVQEIAYLMLSKLRDHRTGVLATTQVRINQLKSEWLRLDPGKVATAEVGVRAMFSVRTSINFRYWQIERELLCISCNRAAAQSLASIAGFRAEELQVSTDWAAETDQFPSTTVTDLRSVVGRALVTAAISCRAVYLVSGQQGEAYQWVGHGDIDKLTKDCFMWCLEPHDQDSMRPLLDRESSGPMEVLGKPIDERLKRLFRPMMRAGSAVLLNKTGYRGQRFPPPIWCLMIFKQVDFNDTRAIRDILAEVAARREFYTISHGTPAQSLEELRHPGFNLDSDDPDIDGWLQELNS
ncbi:hypothetical protein CLAIMM_07502 [Cladophialophora immunda]|nr:hypothetical protein CLAIMM_07502 [Cladophialophora immunda]